MKTAKQWKYHSPSKKLISTISNQFQLSKTLARLLINRGLTDPDKIDAFLKPTLSQLFNPFHFRDLPKAITRLREAIDREYRLVENAIQNIKAAIQVVQTKVGLIRSSETIALQKDMKRLQEEGISLQSAASFIEFVIVFYYGLGVWKILADDVFHHIPASIVFIIILSFALSVTALTHFISKSRMQNWKMSKGLIISAVAVISIWILAELLTWLARTLFT